MNRRSFFSKAPLAVAAVVVAKETLVDTPVPIGPVENIIQIDLARIKKSNIAEFMYNAKKYGILTYG